LIKSELIHRKDLSFLCVYFQAYKLFRQFEKVKVSFIICIFTFFCFYYLRYKFSDKLSVAILRE